MSDVVVCKCRKSMVIHDTECSYLDQVSLNNTNQTNQPIVASQSLNFVFLSSRTPENILRKCFSDAAKKLLDLLENHADSETSLIVREVSAPLQLLNFNQFRHYEFKAEFMKMLGFFWSGNWSIQSSSDSVSNLGGGGGGRGGRELKVRQDISELYEFYGGKLGLLPDTAMQGCP